MYKQIEEMAREMCKSNLTKLYAKCDDCFAKKYCGFWKCSEDLINAGYRKIPEGTVVLAKEKYENLQALKDDYVKGYEAGVDEGWDAARTETVDKFAERLFEEAFADFSDDDYDRLCILVIEIAKEIKES